MPEEYPAATTFYFGSYPCKIADLPKNLIHHLSICQPQCECSFSSNYSQRKKNLVTTSEALTDSYTPTHRLKHQHSVKKTYRRCHQCVPVWLENCTELMESTSNPKTWKDMTQREECEETSAEKHHHWLQNVGHLYLRYFMFVRRKKLRCNRADQELRAMLVST